MPTRSMSGWGLLVHPTQPALEKAGGGGGAVEAPEAAEGFLEGAGTGQYQLQLFDFGESLLLRGCLVGGITQPVVAGVFEGVVSLRAECAVFLPPHRIHGFVEQGAHMEGVERDVRFGKGIPDSLGVGAAHVHGHGENQRVSLPGDGLDGFPGRFSRASARNFPDAPPPSSPRVRGSDNTAPGNGCASRTAWCPSAARCAPPRDRKDPPPDRAPGKRDAPLLWHTPPRRPHGTAPYPSPPA